MTTVSPQSRKKYHRWLPSQLQALHDFKQTLVDMFVVVEGLDNMFRITNEFSSFDFCYFYCHNCNLSGLRTGKSDPQEVSLRFFLVFLFLVQLERLI